MGRKKNVIAPEAKVMDLVAQDQENKRLSTQQVIAALGFDLTEYDRFIFVHAGKSILTFHAFTAIVGGKVLNAIKDNEKHGSFMKALEEIGIAPRKAQRYMELARRFGKYENFSYLSDSKLSVLEDLTDPELEKLDAGEEVKGLTLDRIDQMTAAQARDTLRASEKKIERLKDAHKKEVEKLNEIIDDLKIRAEDPMQLTSSQKAERQLRTLTKDYSIALAKTSAGFRESMSILNEGEKIPGIGIQELNAWLNEFVPDSVTINDLFNQWQAGFERPEPIVDNFSDIIRGKMDVPELG